MAAVGRCARHLWCENRKPAVLVVHTPYAEICSKGQFDEKNDQSDQSRHRVTVLYRIALSLSLQPLLLTLQRSDWVAVRTQPSCRGRALVNSYRPKAVAPRQRVLQATFR